MAIKLDGDTYESMSEISPRSKGPTPSKGDLKTQLPKKGKRKSKRPQPLAMAIQPTELQDRDGDQDDIDIMGLEDDDYNDDGPAPFLL